tara:strand:+ start:110493 stop:110633 length:141 start_codon:yes stop_codon:yes gene_type:complete
MEILYYKYFSFFLMAYLVVFITIIIWFIYLRFEEKKYLKKYNEKFN